MNCLFYLDNDHGDYFLSLSLEQKNSATGILETIPTKIPQFHPIPLLSMSTHEDLTYYIQILPKYSLILIVSINLNLIKDLRILKF